MPREIAFGLCSYCEYETQISCLDLGYTTKRSHHTCAKIPKAVKKKKTPQKSEELWFQTFQIRGTHTEPLGLMATSPSPSVS